MHNTHQNLRKAAVLVASLDADNARAILEQMAPAQAQSVRQAVECLGAVDPREQRQVIEEFFRIEPLVPRKQPSGIELDDRLPKRLSMSPARETESEKPDRSGGAPFRFLHQASTKWLAPFLEREHPQTIAVVVSHLPADRAAEILAGFKAELQIEVARRLVDLDETDPEILREVERGLETWLCQQVRGDRRRTAGLTALNNILGAASPQAKEHILANLARHDRQLSARVKPPQVSGLSFVELEQLEAISLGAVVRHASRELLLLALAGAGPGFAERVYEVLSPDEAQSLAESLRNLGPTRLSDVEQAQQELVESARHLELSGQIVRDRRGRGRLSVAV
jgi:flagellar motor switch protein FliG